MSHFKTRKALVAAAVLFHAVALLFAAVVVSCVVLAAHHFPVVTALVLFGIICIMLARGSKRMSEEELGEALDRAKDAAKREFRARQSEIDHPFDLMSPGTRSSK